MVGRTYSRTQLSSFENVPIHVAESDENKEVVNEQVVQSSDHHSRQNYIPPNMFFPSVLQADDDGDVGHMATAAGAGGGRVLRTHSF